MLTLYFVLCAKLPQKKKKKKTKKVIRKRVRSDQASMKCLISNPIKLSWKDVKESVYIFVT